MTGKAHGTPLGRLCLVFEYRKQKKYSIMEILPTIGCYEFTAEPFHCDFARRLFLGHLGNHLLNAADFHSHERGIGMGYLNTLNRTWVLSRLALEIDEMPAAYDRFTVETWVESAMRFFTSRCFRVVGKSGRIYSYGHSIWAMIDTISRQPVDILAVRDGIITQYIDKSHPLQMDKASRVRIDEAGEWICAIDTHYSDVDMNGHINSIKYIEHLLNLWNLDWHGRNSIQRLDIAYVAEAHQGDRLNFYSFPVLKENCGQREDSEYKVRITKKADATPGEVEVCRCRIIFKVRS